MYEVCSNSHVTSALLERLKCRKKGNKGTPNQMACFPRTIEIQGMHAFLFDKQPSISSETTCLKKLQKQTPKEQYNPQFSTPANYMNIKPLG